MSIYRPLKQRTNEVRLFRMHGANSYHDTIVGDLEYVNLSQPPPFHAVSYHCGNPSRKSVVIVNDQVLEVVSNCEEVLKALRQRGVLYVWIDQICINQEENDEKSAQILRIAFVYQEAIEVIVWLGPHADGSNELLSCDLQSLSQQYLTPQRSYQIQALFTRGYWRRAWIIQEIAAAIDIRVWCGNSTIRWESIENLLNIWLTFKLGADAASTELQHTKLLELYESSTRDEAELFCLRFVRDSRNEGHPFTLLNLLQLFHRSQAGDTRDKVYSLLGLAWDRAHFITEPSYDVPSVQQLCREMTRACFTRKRSMDVMFFAGQRSAVYGLPSWCPFYISLARDLVTTNLNLYLASQNTKYRLGKAGYRWQTTAGSFTSVDSFYIDGNCLVSKGYLVDEVVALGKLASDMRDHIHDDRKIPSTSRAKLLESMARAFMMYDRNYTRYGRIPHQPALLYDSEFKLQGHRPKVAESNEVLREWRKRHVDFRISGMTMNKLRTWRELDYEFKSLGNMLTSTWDSKMSFTASMNYEQITVAMAMVFREQLRLMVSKNDRMGWAHPDALPGDKVFLFPGCSMPAILRPDSSGTMTFKLIGHCYLDGLMDGQVWKECEQQQAMKMNVRIV